MKPATAPSFWRGSAAGPVGLLDRRQQQRPALDEELVQDLVLGAEVVVDEPVGDAGLVGDVGDAGRVEALAGEDADRGVEDLAALVGRRRFRHQARASRSAAARRRRRAAVGERRQRLADPVLRGEVEVGGDEALPVGGGREHDSPGVDDRRVAEGVEVRRRRRPTWLGARTKSLVLDRPRPQQHLPVVAAGRAGEGGGHGEQAGAAQGEDRGRARGSAGRNRR